MELIKQGPGNSTYKVVISGTHVGWVKKYPNPAKLGTWLWKAIALDQASHNAGCSTKEQAAQFFQS